MNTVSKGGNIGLDNELDTISSFQKPMHTTKGMNLRWQHDLGTIGQVASQWQCVCASLLTGSLARPEMASLFLLFTFLYLLLLCPMLLTWWPSWLLYMCVALCTYSPVLGHHASGFQISFDWDSGAIRRLGHFSHCFLDSIVPAYFYCLTVVYRGAGVNGSTF